MNTLTISKGSTILGVERKAVSFSAVLVVYKSNEGYWKGFVHPYGITSQATSKDKALKYLKEQIEVYRDELKKYDFPTNLIYQHLLDIEDREMFSVVLKDAIEKKGIIDKENYHAETYTVQP